MQFKTIALLLATTASGVSAIELTPDNYDAETSGKSVFLKFFAPWLNQPYRVNDQTLPGVVTARSSNLIGTNSFRNSKVQPLN